MDPHNLSEAFAVWAAVVGLIGVAIVWELSRLRGEVKKMNQQLNDHMLTNEHRVTSLEVHLKYRDGEQPPEVRGNVNSRNQE
jgi:Flp pilus assembly pilin Flp